MGWARAIRSRKKSRCLGPDHSSLGEIRFWGGAITHVSTRQISDVNNAKLD